MTEGERQQREHRWYAAFWVSVLLLAVCAAVWGKGESYAEQAVRCNDQHITSFDMCMGWVEGRVMR